MTLTAGSNRRGGHSDCGLTGAPVPILHRYSAILGVVVAVAIRWGWCLPTDRAVAVAAAIQAVGVAAIATTAVAAALRAVAVMRTPPAVLTRAAALAIAILKHKYDRSKTRSRSRRTQHNDGRHLSHGNAAHQM